MFDRITTGIEANLLRFYRLWKEGSWIFLGQVATMLGGLALVKVLTEYLEPSEYGEVALGLTLANLVNLVIMGTLSSGVSRFFSIASEKNDLGGYLKSSVKLLCLAVITTVSIGLLVGVALFFSGGVQWLGMVLVIVLYSLFAGYNGALSSMQNAARQRSIVALHNGMDAWLKIGFAVLLIVSFGSSSIMVIVGYLCSSTLISASQTYHLKKLLTARKVEFASSSSGEWMTTMWLYSWPFLIWGVFGWAQQSSTRWALEAFVSTEDVGRYAVVAQIGYFPIQMGIGLLMTFIMPILYARAGDASDAMRRKGVDIMIHKIALTGVLLTLIASFTTAIFHEFIFQVLVAEEYRSISKYMPIMVLAGGVFGIALVVSSRFFAFLAPSKLIPASIGSSVIGIVAAFVCTYYFSILGAVFAMLIHSISFLVLTMITGIRK